VLTNAEIREIIPHRYPFLLIDKVLEVEPGKKAVAIKCVTCNEPFFEGHFPKSPVMPGVLIVEALAQTACVAGAMLEENKGKIGLFTAIHSMRFRKQVMPGDVLRLEAEFIKIKMGMGKVKVMALVDGTVAAEGEIGFAMVDKIGEA